MMPRVDSEIERALAFYADPATYHSKRAQNADPITVDSGGRARAALTRLRGVDPAREEAILRHTANVLDRGRSTLSIQEACGAMWDAGMQHGLDALSRTFATARSIPEVSSEERDGE